MITLNENNVGKFNLFSTFLILFFFAISISIFSVNSRIDDFEVLKTTVKNEFVQQNKKSIKNRVEQIMSLIQNQDELSVDYLKSTIKQRVYNSHSIVEKIYKKYKDTKTKKEIIELVKEVLRPLRYDNGTGYVFMASLDGIDLLFPVLPQVENTNVLNLQDAKGNFVVQEEIALVKNHQEGYLKDFWTKPNTKDTTMIYPKITFVKSFDALNLYIGTGMYIDDAKQQSKEYIKELVVQMNKQDLLNYLTITEFENTDVTKNSLTIIVHPNLAPGFIIKDSVIGDLSALKSNGETYLSYKFKNLITQKDDDKTTFLKYNENWKWIVGAGFYNNELNKEISRLEEKQKQLINKQIYTHIFLLILFGGTLLLIIYLLNKFTEKIFYNYKEDMAKKELALKSLNETLEHKVQKRTLELQESEIELQKLNQELRTLTNIDPLTGIYNRRYFYSISKDMIALSIRENNKLSLAVIDIDNFKSINDTYGHDIGDDVLKLLVEEVNRNIRSSDIFIRYGGEEFIVILPNTSTKQTIVVLEKVRKAISQYRFINDISFTISIGISTFQEEDGDIEPLFKRADLALYTAKHSGKNRLEIYKH